MLVKFTTGEAQQRGGFCPLVPYMTDEDAIEGGAFLQQSGDHSVSRACTQKVE